MLAHYLKVKRGLPEDTLLLYRMGDFYELFFEDAITAARVLDIALTHRGQHQGQDVPMCGVPVHARDAYLARLVRRGCRVAVCEQMETPAQARQRGPKALVRRDLVRIITPGTLVEEELLPPERANILLAVWGTPESSALGLAWAEVSTGETRCREASVREALGLIARLSPQEVLLPADTEAHLRARLDGPWDQVVVSPVPTSSFQDNRVGEEIPPLARRAYGALVSYVAVTHVGKEPPLRSPIAEDDDRYLALDAATRASLELTRTLSGQKRGSLLGVLDETLTGAGARLLAHRLNTPLVEETAIGARQDSVAFFQDRALREELRGLLRGAPDMGRALGRLNAFRPRDLAVMREGLKIARGAAAALEIAGKDKPLPAELAQALEQLRACDDSFTDELQRALTPTPPVHFAQGDVIAPDYHGGLDALKEQAHKTRRRLLALQAHCAQHTGIRTLKVRYNNVLGYYLETPLSSGKKLLEPPGAKPISIAKPSPMRCASPPKRWGTLAGEILTARDKAAALEREIFETLVETTRARTPQIGAAAQALGVIDVSCALAHVAEARDYVRPDVDSSCLFEITQGRHPVVEALSAQPFIANDCHLDPEQQRLLLMTAPNMAGKSTFLRQNALIVILAQMGAFVPARAARIGVVDRLFSRVGAADDLAAGRSTFMVEMVETVAILNRATKRSFVIVDEVGRGTATFDGLALAWSVLERLHEVNACRTLFATHYHELTALTLKGLGKVTMRVEKHKQDVIFLHEVVPGCADHSYGLQVAALAGLPREALARAEEILAHLHKEQRDQGEIPPPQGGGAAHIPRGFL